jgi:ribosomal protein S27AE
MSVPKINVASLRCPRCSEPAILAGIARVDSPSDDEILSFECARCGPFEVLTLTESGSEPACDRHIARPGAELQDLWA